MLIPNGDHGGDAFNGAKYQKVVDDFFDTYLRGPFMTRRRAARH
ncbi:MAG TPA: hypothetical protein VEK79_15450 [Thermoanaerobaculia bacterium]|nr:hypothetical protein [Thermoanaerobaculia bacterium]